MSQKPKLRRGFVKEAEIASLSHREALGLTVKQACPARKLARRLGLRVVSAEAIAPSLSADLSEAYAEYLGGPPSRAVEPLFQPEAGFYAFFVEVGGHRMVLYNPNCEPVRQESDLMHELAHVICGHEGQAISFGDDFALRAHDPDHEEEANRMGSILQIPEDGLFWHLVDGRTDDEIANIYGASHGMIQWRKLKSGAVRRAAAYRKKLGR
jgi:hypothetical protein